MPAGKPPSGRESDKQVLSQITVSESFERSWKNGLIKVQASRPFLLPSTLLSNRQECSFPGTMNAFTFSLTGFQEPRSSGCFGI